MKKLEKARQPDPSQINENVKAFEKLWDGWTPVRQEVWMNDIYQVNVERDMPCPGITDDNGDPALITWLSIKRLDKRAVMDWRHMQWIKNQLVGEECEGVELFPAESRLVDGANQFHMWVFQDPTMRYPFGWNYRLVTESGQLGETQRKFPESRKPADLEKNEETVRNLIKEAKAKAE